MVNAAVCDDDPVIVSGIRQFIVERYRQVDVCGYYSGETLLDAARRGVRFHIVVCDIVMEGLSGIEVGQRLRQMPDGDLAVMLFVSHHRNYAGDMIDVGPFRFVPKPIDYDRFGEVFGRAVTLARKHLQLYEKPELFTYKVRLNEYSIAANQIAYLKSRHRLVEIYEWENERIVTGRKFYAQLSDQQDRLPATFLKCERSYIVNLQYVDKYLTDCFELVDAAGTKIPVSRTYQKEARSAFFRYQNGQL